MPGDGSLSWTPPQVVPPSPVPKPTPAGSGLVDGEAFGQNVRGVQPELLSRLRRAEEKAAQALSPEGGPLTSGEYGVYSLVGYRTGSRAHSSGRAVDLNYYANPYVMHTSGDASLDRQLGPVYHRIARLILGRDSAIPEEITQGTPSPDRALRLFHRLREESAAMVRYFSLMPDRTRLQAYLASHADRLAAAFPDSRPAAGDVQQQMMMDYVILAGRPGPKVPGLEYPVVPPPPDTAADGGAEPKLGDRPFAGDPRYRAPELGYLQMREEVFRALMDSGLLWGGSDMGRQSGDLMHFFIPFRSSESSK
jgi:hypothetical protein